MGIRGIKGKVQDRFWLGYNQSLNKQMQKQMARKKCTKCGKSPVLYELKNGRKKEYYCESCAKKEGLVKKWEDGKRSGK